MSSSSASESQIKNYATLDLRHPNAYCTSTHLYHLYHLHHPPRRDNESISLRRSTATMSCKNSETNTKMGSCNFKFSLHHNINYELQKNEIRGSYRNCALQKFRNTPMSYQNYALQCTNFQQHKNWKKWSWNSLSRRQTTYNAAELPTIALLLVAPSSPSWWHAIYFFWGKWTMKVAKTD